MGGSRATSPVPAADLCVIPDRKGMPLEWMSVIADAVTTPYQAGLRGRIQAGDRVIVIGAAGGVGSFMTQIAKAMGAGTVIGIDINDTKLKMMEKYGADATINPKGKGVKEVREAVKAIAKQRNIPSNWGWKVFEVTGTKPGQELALALLSFVGTLVVVGYGTDTTDYMLSRLMAFDAEIIGTWGCPPKYYADCVQMCIDGKLALEPFVEVRPMSQIEKVLHDSHHGLLSRRVILTPDF
jgi:6-hydroxycyclohex-1-ene-1-carbonyl-CoA dehydrogenase